MRFMSESVFGNNEIRSKKITKPAQGGEDVSVEKARREHSVIMPAVVKAVLLLFFLCPTLFFLCPAVVSAQENIEGKASYYSNSLHGRRMSSGKVYHRDSLTCAHKTLPFGTKLRVTNPSNGKEVIVEVADRGPYAHNRVIDLSYAAARELGMIASGVKYVKIEILPEEGSDGYPAPGSLFNILETKYGMAGVCYEFIPEWTDEKKVPEEVKRHPEIRPSQEQHIQKAAHSQQNAAARAPHSANQTSHSAPHPQQKASNKQQNAAHKHNKQADNRTQQQKKETVKNDQSSSSWRAFFDKLKDWGGSFFD